MAAGGVQGATLFFGIFLICVSPLLGVDWETAVSLDVEATGPRIESKGWILMILPVIRLPLQILT